MLIFEFRILFYWEFRILLGKGGGGVCAERGGQVGQKRKFWRDVIIELSLHGIRNV